MPKKPTPKPGPAADTLQLNGNWQDAIKKSLGNENPKGGWPKVGK